MITEEFDKEIIKESQRQRNEYMFCVNCGIDVEITGLGECPKCKADLVGATQISQITKGCNRDTKFRHNLEIQTFWKCGESDGINIFLCDSCKTNSQQKSGGKRVDDTPCVECEPRTASITADINSQDKVKVPSNHEAQTLDTSDNTKKANEVQND